MNRVIIIIFIIGSLIACDGKDKSNSLLISASACASKPTFGEVKDCEVNDSVDEQLSKFLTFSRALDKSHPGPTAPDLLDLQNTPIYDVKQINKDGSIVVENGEKLLLAGLECIDTPDFHRYLNATFVGKYRNKIAYELTGLQTNNLKFAYIWEVGSEYEFGSLASTNETVITSQWCKPIEQDKHLFHMRYKKLSDFAVNNL